MSNDLRHMLHDAAPSPARSFTMAELEGEGRRRQRRRRGVLAAGGVAVVAAAAVLTGLAVTGDRPSDRAVLTPARPSPSPSTPAPSIGVAVQPALALVDGQVVTVSGHGFRPEAQVAMVTCPAEVGAQQAKQSYCDIGNVGYARSDAAGDFSTTYTVKRIISTQLTGQVDCASRPARCRIGVGVVGTRAEGAATDISFSAGAAASATAAVTVAPSSGLRDGTTVTVSGQNFLPQQPIQLYQCPVNTDCGSFVRAAATVTDAHGAFTAQVILHSRVTDQYGGSASCEQACLIAALGSQASDKWADSTTFEVP